MACAAAAGTIALARQYLVDGWYPTGSPNPSDAFIPSAALLKAMAINGAYDDVSGGQVPDNNIGWGRVCLDPVLYFPGDTRWTGLVDHVEGLRTGEYEEYGGFVANPLEPLRISLVWTDYPGFPAAARALVNDLDLTVIDADGVTTYRGNVFSGGQSVPGGGADSLNVEECVWRTRPSLGLWRIRVVARNVPSATQPFALVVSGSLNCSICSVAGAAAGAFASALVSTPNPFNPETTIRFTLDRRGQASLLIYDVSGRLVRRLVDDELAAGPHEVLWDGRDQSGRSVTPGVYFSCLESAGQSAMRKVVLMK